MLNVKVVVFDLHGVLIRAREMGKYYRLTEVDLLYKITGAPREIIRKNQAKAFQNWIIGFQNLKGLQGEELLEESDRLLELWLKDILPLQFLQRQSNLQELGAMLEYQIPLTIGTNFKNAILLPQVLQVLEKLKSTNYLLYIASSAHTRHIRGIIEGTGLTKYFDQIYGFDNLEFMKSDKKFFRALFASQDFPSSKYVVIGNSAQEIIHSKSLGARTILIKHELGDRGEEKDLIKQAFDVADVVCETVEEILEILP